MDARGAAKSPEVVFGREVARLRKRLGISQEELAFRAGVHRTYVSQIERGIKSPTLSVIYNLAHALGYSAGKLVAAAERQL
ncbi:MAG: helix-turn-helix domain-containing protein [bacterium]